VRAWQRNWQFSAQAAASVHAHAGG
jgi:hypothetical protein